MIEAKRRRVAVGHYEVETYDHGEGDQAVFLLSGGPGLPVGYLSAPFLRLVGLGYRVLAYDQLGTGASDRPDDPALWRIERYVEEVETVRRTLGIDRLHLVGHSWGGWLAIEYALAHPQALASLILTNTCADMPHLQSELDRLKSGLGAETFSRMLAHEAEGNFEHWEYRAAISLLNAQHVCRLDQSPPPLAAALADWNKAPYHAVQGPNEFLYVGSLRNWSRLADLHRIAVPTLILCGRHDEMTPACAALMDRCLPDSRVHVLPQSSHSPFYEEPDLFFGHVQRFLDHVIRRRVQLQSLQQ